jgi:hypothetical protein
MRKGRSIETFEIMAPDNQVSLLRQTSGGEYNNVDDMLKKIRSNKVKTKYDLLLFIFKLNKEF